MKNKYPFTMLLRSCLLLCVTLFSFKESNEMSDSKQQFPAFFKVGHRGTRGLMPENTIPAMIKAIETGVNTIEVDVHITKDGKVVVYHDESFNPDYTTKPDGSEIPKADRKQYTFYQMNYADIKPFIIGQKDYPAYPQQQRMTTYAPLLSELIDSVEAYTKSHKLPGVYYLVEIKSKAESDGIEQPAPEEFINILMADLSTKRLGSRLFIQSFDMRPLQVLHRKHPAIRLGFLTGDQKAVFEDNLAKLGFLPAFYNPNYNLVTPELVQKCHAKKMKIECWTVNTLEEMKKQKAMGVDGIITDYPDLLQNL